MKKRDCMAGLVMLGFAIFGSFYLTRALWRAILSGVSPGKLGAIYHAGSLGYFIFIAACLVGIALSVILAVFILRWISLGKSN